MKYEDMINSIIEQIRKHISSTAPNKYGCRIAPRIVCADGFSVSVQGSETHYCRPRETLDDGNYYMVECGYPTNPVEEWRDYADGDYDEGPVSVYACVPIELVAEVIFKHGGFSA